MDLVQLVNRYKALAIDEAIVNAIVHKDYTSNGSVQVMLFKDRLEIWNPGRLPSGLTTEKLRMPHPSIPANPLLAEPMYLAGYIERMGTGTGDIIRLCKEEGMTRVPEFIQEEDFRTIIWRDYVVEDSTEQIGGSGKTTDNVVEKVTDNVVEKVTDKVTDNQAKILELMRENDRITTNELALQINISQRKIKENIVKLKEKNKLSRVGSPKNGYWKVNIDVE